MAQDARCYKEFGPSFFTLTFFYPATHLEKPNPPTEALMVGHHSGSVVGCYKVVFFKPRHRARPSGTRDEFLWAVAPTWFYISLEWFRRKNHRPVRSVTVQLLWPPPPPPLDAAAAAAAIYHAVQNVQDRNMHICSVWPAALRALVRHVSSAPRWFRLGSINTAHHVIAPLVKVV